MRRLPGPVDVDLINKTFFPQDIPSDINKGRCFLWAYIAYRLYDGLQLCDMGAHAFVCVRGKRHFYDSEAPDGVTSWKKLKATFGGSGCGCWRCMRGRKTYRAAGHFRRSWSRCAKQFKVDWNKVNKQIEEVLCKLHTKQSLSA